MNPDTAATTAPGYTLGSPAARSEFLTAYAGLLLGLTTMFVVLGSALTRTPSA